MLSIDGGGIRGLVAVEFIARIEELLRAEFHEPDLVLAQYFDYFAGTSTGAIVATLLSLGYSAQTIRNFYVTGGKMMFDANAFQRFARRTKGPASAIAGVLGIFFYRAMYRPDALEREIKRVVGDPPLVTLGTQKLQTLLLIVTRNASTDSPWPLSNNPNAKYNLRDDNAGSARPTNLDLPLWQLVRASTAAPVYFPAEEIHVPGLDAPFVFVDGAVSMYNNPAFQLFLMATLPGYRLGWKTGPRELLLISVGTGSADLANLHLDARQMNLLYNVTSTPAALIHSAAVEQDMLCRIFGRVRSDCALAEIDAEIGNLIGVGLPPEAPLFSYARYNVELSKRSLQKLGFADVAPAGLQRLDGVDYIDDLSRVGAAAAKCCVDIADFEGFLDPGLLRPRRPPPFDGPVSLSAPA